MGIVPSARSCLGRLIRLPLRAIPRNWQMPILMGPARGKRWIVGSSDHGMWLGTHVRPARRAFQKIVRPGDVVYDVGAFTGFYTLLASVLVGPRGRVFAFEPSPANGAYLKEHLRINRITNVTVIEAAVGERSGTVCFEQQGSASISHVAAEGPVRVRMVTLDEFIRDEGTPRPDVLNIDVVGGEVGLLKGAAGLLREHPPEVFMLVHTFDLNPPWIGMLREFGYDPVPVGHPDFGTPGCVMARKPAGRS